MRFFLPAFLALVPLSAVAQTVGGPEQPLGSDEYCGCGKAEVLRQRAALGLPIGEDGLPGYQTREAMTDTDVLNYKLDIEVIPATDTITGSCIMTVKSLVNNLTQFTFVLRNNYTVSAVLLNGTTAASASAPITNSYARHVTLDRAYSAGEVFTVKVTYSGVAVSRGFGSIDFTTQGGVTGAPTMVETLSEAYFAATWWPCKDGDFALPGDNSDKATLDFSITAPDTLRTVSNGLLVSTTPVAGGKMKYRWVTNYQTATYLACIGTTQYNTWTQTYTYPLAGGGNGTMPVEFNIYPSSDNAGNRAAWEKCLGMMAAYRPYYGEYPFVNEKYGIYQFNFGGGQEHQTNTGEGTFNESVTAHELGHQWWGDNVTCRTWSDIWLNEGFATYTEALWEEHKPGSAGLSTYLAAMVARKPSPTSDSVYVYTTTDMNRIFSSNYTYKKGGWVLHQLRHVVGDATFYQILQTYRAAYQGSAATTADFEAIASSVSGLDLHNFFQEWVYGIGSPAYAIGTSPVSINGQNYLKVSLRQTQNAAWPGAAAQPGYFGMPIDLRINTGLGSSTVVLNNNARTQHFVVPTSAAATSSALDEFDWVLNTAKASEAYVAGPPKIVGAAPAPNENAPAGAVSSVAITFSEAVTAPSSAFTVTGPGGAVAFTYAYVPATLTSTLTFASPLSAGTYTVSAGTAVTSVGAGAALDGETPGTALVQTTAFPSGDGLAGGGAVWAFTVQGPSCGPSDFDGDGDAGTDFDIQAFFACLGGNCCGGCFAGGADFDGDGDSGTDADIQAFFRVLGGGPC